MSKQPRIAFFVHDGGGFGHLRRMARLASAIKNEAACLFLCGHRAAAWIVPPECEYLHVPSRQSLILNRCERAVRKPFGDMHESEARFFRKALLTAAISSFNPDVILVDYLPSGKDEELAEIVLSHRARKIFIMRGVMSDPAETADELFSGINEILVQRAFKKILVACDPRICDVVSEYKLPPEVAANVQYIGYVSEPVSSEAIATARAKRGVPAGKNWVVCSTGSGFETEPLSNECIRVSRELSDAYFTVVTGSRSGAAACETTDNGRVEIVTEIPDLSIMHAAADVVVSAGGYNSIVETLEGNADLVVVPVRKANAFEQFTHVRRISEFLPVHVVEDPKQLRSPLVSLLTSPHTQKRPRGRDVFNFQGASNARPVILDLARRALWETYIK